MVLVVVEAVEAVEVVVEVEMSRCFCEKGLGWGCSVFIGLIGRKASALGLRAKESGGGRQVSKCKAPAPPSTDSRSHIFRCQFRTSHYALNLKPQTL